MDPTITEHDFRFPRRPDDRSSRPQAHRGRSSIHELKAELDKTFTVADDLLGEAPLFPTLENANAGVPASVDQMQQEDPLAAQVWKFFSKTKQQLPNQHRMENLTWRMMALNMRKQSQEEQKRYVCEASVF